MPRRVSLPGAAELFRTTHAPEERTAPEPQRSPEPADRRSEARTDGARTEDARTEDARTEDARTEDARTRDARTRDARPTEGRLDGDRTGTSSVAASTTADVAAGETRAADTAAATSAPEPVKQAPPRRRAPVQGSGRVRHDEKITVYVSQDELLALEHARLSLRAEHGMAIDRGRIVREAIAAAIAGLAEEGADSELIRRLTQP